jgi:uncharacterized membrane protein
MTRSIMSNTKRVSIFALLLIASWSAAACGEDLPEVDCNASAVPKYSELTILPNCTNCHDSKKMGPVRLSAPTDINLDTYEAARSAAEESVEQVFAKKMPYPDGSGVTEEARQQFYRWGLCGTPN